jgi:predicted transcriptional regulator
MKLGEYLNRRKLTRSAFAEIIGVSHAAVVRYINGTRRPEWPVIDRIREATNGAVRARDFEDEDVAA